MNQPAADGAPSSVPRTCARLVLGAFLVFAGVAHVSFARTTFYAQIPPWLPMDRDFVVIASGVVELAIGAGLLFLPRWRVVIGWLTAALFVAVFPGNVSQFLTRSAAFGLDSDLSRAIRLPFQPLLVLLALWCTGAWGWWRARRAGHWSGG